MITTIHAVAVCGLNASFHPIAVQPSEGITVASSPEDCLPEHRARETRVRVRAALIPFEKVTGAVLVTAEQSVPLGSHNDAAYAIALLCAAGKVPAAFFEDTLVLGEVSLTAGMRPARGVATIARRAAQEGFRRIIVASANEREAREACDLPIFAVSQFFEIVGAAREGRDEVFTRFDVAPRESEGVDASDVRGMPEVMKLLEVAAIGHLSVLFIGPNGCGKTMLARRLVTMLPTMTAEQRALTTEIHSAAGLLPSEGISGRPFRAPHHTLSHAGMVGGGEPVRPGEVNLAHNGVLFVDEVNELRGGVADGLKYALQQGATHIVRKGMRVSFPSSPLLVGAVHPCPCGFHGHPKMCSCSAERVAQWKRRMVGGLWERFDIRITLPPPNVRSVAELPRYETSAVIRERVTAARMAFDHDRAITLTDTDVRVRLPQTGYDEAPKVGRIARALAASEGAAEITAAHMERAVELRGVG